MIKLSFLNLFRRKSRTALAVLGIVIGVGAIVSMVSVVDGMFFELNETVGQFQGLLVREKDTIDPIFSELEVGLESKLEAIQGVRIVVPERWVLPSEIDGEGSGGNLFSAIAVYGVDVFKFNRLRGGTGWIGPLAEGTSLRTNNSKAVIIGKKLSEDRDKFVGSTIKINDTKFRVRGIFESDSDLINQMILMGMDDVRDISSFPEGFVNSFYVELVDPTKDAQIAKAIEFRFPGEIQADSASDLSEQFGSILDNFRLVVFFVAAISAIVAGVGIANTLLMSVSERMKEIGTLKAVGWTGGDVIKMIIYESLFIGAVGGIAGIVFGFVAGIAMNLFVGLPTLVSPLLVAEAFGFAIAVSLLAGIYPALRASSLDPIEAIRTG